jgi:hypothetical protein
MVGTWVDWISYVVDLLATAAVLTAAIRFLKGEFSRVLGTANGMLKQLEDSKVELGRIVEARTAELSDAQLQAERRVHQLETVAQVARTIAAVRDLDQILPAITRVISQQYGYYHVGIFLVDELQEFRPSAGCQQPRRPEDAGARSQAGRRTLQPGWLCRQPGFAAHRVAGRR